MSKINSGGNSLLKDLVSGVNKTASIVGKTLGPKGKNVILKEKDKKPIVTKDGVTIAKFLNFENVTPLNWFGARISLISLWSITFSISLSSMDN